MEELKPCPFCGGEAIGFEWSDDDEVDKGERHADDAYCAVKANHKDDCLLKVGEFCVWIASTEKEAAEIWNTRVERTCHLSDKHPAHSFDGQARDCPECGYEFDCDCGEDKRFYCCPGCGAKVVDDD